MIWSQAPQQAQQQQPPQQGRGGGGRGGTPTPQGQNANGMHIFLWGGLKSHGVGQHDYPQFFADWSKVLTEHGAVVDGALHPPTAADLVDTDVVVIYKGDAAYLSDEEKKILTGYVKRGGGLVSFHDSLCGPDPAYFATMMGGGKHHGETNFRLDAPIPYTVVDKESPIMKGFPNETITDEAFYSITWAGGTEPKSMPDNPQVHVLATASIADTPSGHLHAGEVVPQIWTYEHTLPGGQPARAFVWMQGHVYENFARPEIQNMLLRGIAWAGNKPVEELASYVPPAPRGGRGRGTQPPAKDGKQ
jgi:type 1 glutamine amidotransferase